MSMFGPREGMWWVNSKTDPRWNREGRGCGFVTSGGPSEIQEWIDRCKQEYGKPPADLQIGFMKD